MLAENRGLNPVLSGEAFSVVMEPASAAPVETIALSAKVSAEDRTKPQPSRALARLLSFFCLIGLLALGMHWLITSGLRNIRTSAFGASNLIMTGKVNAQVVITGSSRALLEYDPRAIEATTGRTAFNLGRNGSQTDMQVAFFKAYLDHNRKPQIVLHNLDAFSFVTTREIFDPAQYMPYLNDPALYDASRKINPETWRSRYIPLYGYVVEDMNFTWIHGLTGFFGWQPHEDFFLGFNPRHMRWTGDFESYKAANPHGVHFDVEPAGVDDLKDLIMTCRQNGIQLIFVYAPEYTEMQKLTNNRAQIFAKFRQLSERYNVPLWDYSDWPYDSDKDFFYNSQHLNAHGAEVFSTDVAGRLQQFLLAQSGLNRNATMAAGASGLLSQNILVSNSRAASKVQ